MKQIYEYLLHFVVFHSIISIFFVNYCSRKIFIEVI